VNVACLHFVVMKALKVVNTDSFESVARELLEQTILSLHVNISGPEL
jgi:hypothetical protein